MQTLEILVGMIASGKSTYCKQQAQRNLSIIVNDDAIVELCHAGNPQLYRQAGRGLYKAIELQIAITALSRFDSVVVDKGVCISARSRRRWVGLAHAFDVHCRAVVFIPDTPERHAQKRFESDSRGYSLGYWQGVAKEHAAKWEEPTLAEGFDEIIRIPTWFKNETLPK